MQRSRETKDSKTSSLLASLTSNSPSLDSINISHADLHSTMFLRLCAFLSLLTGVNGLVLCLTHLYITQMGKHFHNIHTILIHIYFALFGMLVFAIEFDFQLAIQQFKFFESWLGRGIFLYFNGLMLNLLATSSAPSLALPFCKLLSTTTCLLGVIYFAFGVLCLRQLKLREIHQIKKKKLIQAQADQLSIHKTEIEKLLAETQSRIKVEV